MWRRDLLFTIPIVIIKLCHHWPVEERLSRSYCPIFFFNTNPNSSRIKRNYEIRENAIRKKKKRKKDRPVFNVSSFLSLSPPIIQILLLNTFSKNRPSRIESNRIEWIPLATDFLIQISSRISFSFRWRTVCLAYACGDRDCICVGGRGALRSIYLRSSWSPDHETETKNARCDSHAARTPLPLLLPRDIWHGLVGRHRFRDRRHAKSRVRHRVKSDSERSYVITV